MVPGIAEVHGSVMYNLSVSGSNVIIEIGKVVQIAGPF